MSNRKVVNKKKRKRSMPASTVGVPRTNGSIDRWDIVGNPSMRQAFDNADQLARAFDEYQEWAKNNPLTTEQLSYGKGNKLMHRTTEKLGRPLTIMGFTRFINKNTVWWAGMKKMNYAQDGAFTKVIADIEDACRSEKFAGAAVGKYNANLISRDLALADNMNVVDGRKQTSELFPDEDDFKDKKKGK